MTPGTGSARLAAGIAGSALLVAGLTVAARVTGFGRVFAFSGSVGAGCTGTAYAAANQVPNVLFEVVAGGALAAAVVPAVAAALTRGGEGEANRVASALLTWTVLALTPVAVLLALLAGPVTRLLLGGGPATDGACPGAAELAARMLVVFAPQIVLYGVGIVLAGVLQAHHRFAGPALAPLLSSVVVIAAYLGYAALTGPAHRDPAFVPDRAAELVLAGGTTLGVVALSLPLLLPARRSGVRLRPTLRFPPGVAARVRALALAGVAALAAQQMAVVAVLALAIRSGGTGALPAYQYAQAAYLLPYAVLAVPLATAAFPRLARQAADGDTAAFAGTTARTTRGVLAASAVGAAALAATAPAWQRLFERLDAVGSPALAGLGPAVTALAPGLLGWALVAHLGRALAALHRGRVAALATVAGWLAVVAASVVAVRWLGAGERAVLGLGVGNSVGMTVAGILLLVAVRRVAGAPAVAGVPGTLLRAAGGAVVAAAIGRVVADAVLRGMPGLGGAVLAGLAGAVVVLVVAGAALLATERELAAPLLARLTARRRPPAGRSDVHHGGGQGRTGVHDRAEEDGDG